MKVLQLVWKSFSLLPKVKTYMKTLSHDAVSQEHAISVFTNSHIDKIREVLFNTLIVSQLFNFRTIFPVSFELRKYICLDRPYHFKLFKGGLPQILLGPFLNTLTHLMLMSHITWVAFLNPLAPIILIYDQGCLTQLQNHTAPHLWLQTSFHDLYLLGAQQDVWVKMEANVFS